MSARRVSLPQADDLFRATETPAAIHVVPPPDEQSSDSGKGQRTPAGRSGHSGRVKHDEKMTVYLSSDELLELEHARLLLRKELGSAVDRGRIVRAAVALALEELEAEGHRSALARRLHQS